MAAILFPSVGQLRYSCGTPDRQNNNTPVRAGRTSFHGQTVLCSGPKARSQLFLVSKGNEQETRIAIIVPVLLSCPYSECEPCFHQGHGAGNCNRSSRRTQQIACSTAGAVSAPFDDAGPVRRRLCWSPHACLGAWVRHACMLC